VIFEVPELSRFVWISAFNARPENVDEFFHKAVDRHPTESLQLVDLDKVPGERYLRLASINALKSFSSKQPIARTLAMELLVYLAGERQIAVALKQVGVSPQTRRVAVIGVGASNDRVSILANSLTELLGQTNDDRLLNEWSEARVQNVRSGFDIGNKELKAVRKKGEPVTMAMERLAIERSAMVAASK